MSEVFVNGDNDRRILSKILTNQAGAYTYNSGDSDYGILRKILMNMDGGYTYNGGDSDYGIVRKILLNQEGPFAYTNGDSFRLMLSKILRNQPASAGYNSGDSDYLIEKKILESGELTLHPDTSDWLIRVAAAGGSVSSSTILAADNFARDINDAGERSSIARANLFCGDFTAALVPFYIGYDSESILGSPTDTSFNFDGSSYTETGASGGFKGNGTDRYIDTGLLGVTMGVTLVNVHSSVFCGLQDTKGVVSQMIGFRESVSVRNTLQVDSATMQTTYGPPSVTWSSALARGLNLGIRNLTQVEIWNAGLLRASMANSGQSPAGIANSYFVFAENRGTAQDISNALLSGYSLGRRILNPVAYNAAWVRFQTALGRTTS